MKYAEITNPIEGLVFKKRKRRRRIAPKYWKKELRGYVGSNVLRFWTNDPLTKNLNKDYLGSGLEKEPTNPKQPNL